MLKKLLLRTLGLLLFALFALNIAVQAADPPDNGLDAATYTATAPINDYDVLADPDILRDDLPDVIAWQGEQNATATTTTTTNSYRPADLPQPDWGVNSTAITAATTNATTTATNAITDVGPPDDLGFATMLLTQSNFRQISMTTDRDEGLWRHASVGMNSSTISNTDGNNGEGEFAWNRVYLQSNTGLAKSVMSSGESG